VIKLKKHAAQIYVMLRNTGYNKQLIAEM